MIRIAIIDDHVFFRLGVKYAMEEKQGFHIAGEACDEEALFALLADIQVDMALLGVNAPDSLGCGRIVRRLRREYPAVKILAMANESAVKTLQYMAEKNIDGYIGKRQASHSELAKAIRETAAGRAYTGTIESNQHVNSD
ncbi:MAG: response regulator [Tannerella sp.]|jgi:DNA-binding NarL/FixJ family response regulator|nr:response regulator [Tannerella sp.]